MSEYSDLVVAHGASSYWRLGEGSGLTATDLVGGKHGTISGGVTLNQPGALADGDRAMGFNGSTGKIATVANVTVPPVCTIEAWMQATVGGRSYWGVRFPNATEDTIGLAFASVTALQCFVTYANAASPNSNHVVNLPVTVGDGRWHHVVWTFPGGTVVKVFVDGVEYAVTPLTRALVGATLVPVEIGVAAALGNNWNGSLDEVAVYPLALTPAQIGQHYQVGRLGFPAGTYPERIIRDGASAYWRLNDPSGTIASELIGGKHGTISGGVTLGQPGALVEGDSAMGFNGTTGKVVTTASDITLPAVATVEAWVKTTNAVPNKAILSLRNVAGSGSRTVCYCYNAFAIWTTSGVTGTRVVSDGQWHHGVWVLDGATCKIYVDGVLDISGAHVRPSGTNQISLGWEFEGNNWMDGALDEVAIYPYALSPAQIAQHYALGSTRVYPPGSYPATVLASAPSAYWRLNEASGTIASEIIGGKDGTISGGVTLNQRGALMDGDPAMTFNGTTGKVVTAANVTLTPSYTIEGWVNFNVVTVQLPMVNIGSGVYVGIKDSLPFAYFAVNGRQGTRNVRTGWHHLVYVVTVNSVSFYVDGLLDVTQGGMTLNPVTGLVELGWSSFTTEFWNGQLDEVAIYPRALPAAEILAHYQARTSGLSPYAARVVGDGASAYWRLGETSGTTAVEVINGVNGTISGGVTLAQPGALLDGDKAMGWDNTNTGKILTPSESVTIPATCSIEAWVKYSGSPGGQRPIVSGRAPGGFATLLLVVAFNPTGTVLFYATPGGAVNGVRNIATDNAWHHLVCVNTATTALIYVDGAVDQTAARVLGADTGQLTIGYDLVDLASWFGSLDEVAIYPLALTPAQIKAHYDLGVYGYTTSVGIGPDTNSKVFVYVTGPSTDNTTKVAKHLPQRSGEMTARMKKLIQDAGASN